MGLCMKLKGYIKIRISLQYIYNRQSNEEYIHCLSTRYVQHKVQYLLRMSHTMYVINTAIQILNEMLRGKQIRDLTTCLAERLDENDGHLYTYPTRVK